MNGSYEKAIRQAVLDAEIAFDPCHAVQHAQRAVDDDRRREWNDLGESASGHGRWIKGIRWSLLKAPERQSVGQLAALHEVQQSSRHLYRAFLLKEQLRLLYHLPGPLPPGRAPASRSARRSAPSLHETPAGNPHAEGSTSVGN